MTENSQQKLARMAPPDYRTRPLTEAIAVSLVAFLAILLTTLFIYQRAVEAQNAEIRQGLVRLAKVVRTTIDVEAHKSFTDPAQQDSEEYRRANQPFEDILFADDQIAFVYTGILRDGQVRFVLDGTPDGFDASGDGESDAVDLLEFYMDEDSSDENPDMWQALNEQIQIVSDEPYTDEWGTFFSAYVPFYDAEDTFVGVVGIDLRVDDYFERLAPIKRATQRTMVAGFFIAFMFGSIVWFLRHFIYVLNQKRIRLWQLAVEEERAASKNSKTDAVGPERSSDN